MGRVAVVVWWCGGGFIWGRASGYGVFFCFYGAFGHVDWSPACVQSMLLGCLFHSAVFQCPLLHHHHHRHRNPQHHLQDLDLLHRQHLQNDRSSDSLISSPLWSLRPTLPIVWSPWFEREGAICAVLRLKKSLSFLWVFELCGKMTAAKWNNTTYAYI